MKKLFTFKTYIVIASLATIIMLMIIASELSDLNSSLKCSGFLNFNRTIGCEVNNLNSEVQEIKKSVEDIEMSVENIERNLRNLQ